MLHPDLCFKTVGFCTTVPDGPFNLPAKFIIHTVGPIWYGGTHQEPETLKNSYKNSLKLTTLYAIKTIAFPAISCGAYGYPIDQAVQIALNTLRAELPKYPYIEKIIICTYTNDVFEQYQKAWTN